MKILILSLFLSVYAFTGNAISMLEKNPMKVQVVQKPEKMTLLANPIKDGMLKLSFSNLQSDSMNVVVINSLGKQVFKAERSLNKQVQIFDVSTIASGIYYLRVNTNRSNFVKKLIIQ
ncbi:T9SS type A sorting domain-containing protein [Nonlabens antarcticus]|uniref:T9SS type A sorting domain-containing protein n=1 Tax=Nonlabens antarcticus TaxID=392714 RepID=UPI0018914229|nr:T9SS type A sorting domain-containing protein [Nonlabens antarcticus]